MLPSTQSVQTTELQKDDVSCHEMIATLSDIWETLESAKKNKEKQIVLLDKMKNSGLLLSIVDLLSGCDSVPISKILISCIRNIGGCKENKYIESIMDKTLSLKLSLPAPTFGIFCLLDAVSWCDVNIRPRIINEDTLNYVLSNINISAKPAIKLATVQSRLLFILMHLEYSVGGDFIAKQLDDISLKLNHFLNIDDTTILENTLNCFKKFVCSNKLIPQQSMLKISNLLATNNRDLVKICLKGVEDLLSTSNRFVTFEHLESTIELFTKCNLWQNLSVAFNFFINNNPKNKEHINCVSSICNIIEKCLQFVAEDIAEFMVHSMIENNLIHNIMKVVNRVKPKWHFKLLWRIMIFASDEDACFMIICMDIIPYLCDQAIYSELIRIVEKLNADKPWLQQDSTFDVQCLIYTVFHKILKFDMMYKSLNGKDVCSKLMVKYGAVNLIETIRKDVEHNNDKNVTKKRKDSLLILLKDLNQKEMNSLDSEWCDVSNESNANAIISFIAVEYNKKAIDEIPSCIEALIGRFYLVKCDFVVPYLKMQLDFDGMVIVNKKKICAFCQNIQINMQRCSGCKYVFYCNRLCQQKDWKPTHKTICATIKKVI